VHDEATGTYAVKTLYMDTDVARSSAASLWINVPVQIERVHTQPRSRVSKVPQLVPYVGISLLDPCLDLDLLDGPRGRVEDGSDSVIVVVSVVVVTSSVISVTHMNAFNSTSPFSWASSSRRIVPWTSPLPTRPAA